MKSELKNPEFELLLAVIQSEHSPNNILSGYQIDWDYLLELATRHGLLPLLHLGQKKIKAGEIPARVTEYLKTFYFENTQSNILLLGKLVRLLQLLDEAGIKATPFKGVLLAKDLYDSYAMRQAGDIDILVRPEEVPRIVEILQTDGYVLEYPFSRNQQIALARISKEKRINMILRERKLVIEIHWRVFTRELIGKPETEFIWDNLEDFIIQNTKTKIFKPEVMFMYLCFHAYKHNWQRLFMLWEIDQFIRKNQNLNWDWILKNSGNFGSANILFLSLLVVKDLFGTELPPMIRDQITENQIVHQLFNQVEIGPDRFQLDANKKIDFLSLNHMTKIHSKKKDRALQFLRLAITPTHFDIIAFDLPPGLHFLYYILRPLRLLGKNIKQLFSLPQP